MDDSAFLANTADKLATLDHVVAVALGGSRAQGTNRPDSDWDLAIYYRGGFEPQQLRDIGWPGDVFDIGGWGGGIFNGGAWLEIDGRKVDVHYRDLARVEAEAKEATAGRFGIEPLMFHLAGVPTYIVLAELAINRTLSGELPKPEFPQRLRETAPDRWAGIASMNLDYAVSQHAQHDRAVQFAGLAAVAACQFAHAILARRGEWVTNEKQLLSRAGLANVITSATATVPGVDQMTRQAAALRAAVDAALR